MTDNFATPEMVKDSVYEVALDNLAVGLDPRKSTLFIQSQVPAIAELTVFYANLVSVQRLGHNPTVKTELKQKGLDKSVPLGFFMYPVSQAADITCVNANLVPVGVDQLPHIEQTKEIVRRFNELYGQTLNEPEALLSEFPRLPGIDGQNKMSKSLGNAIYLSDDAETVTQKVKKMYTDPTRIHATDPGHIEGNTVFTYLAIFDTDSELYEEMKKDYVAGKLGDVVVKERLTKVLNEFLEPIRVRRQELAAHPNEVWAILREGTLKANEVSQDVLAKVKEAMKIHYSQIR